MKYAFRLYLQGFSLPSLWHMFCLLFKWFYLLKGSQGNVLFWICLSYDCYRMYEKKLYKYQHLEYVNHNYNKYSLTNLKSICPYLGERREKKLDGSEYLIRRTWQPPENFLMNILYATTLTPHRPAWFQEQYSDNPRHCHHACALHPNNPSHALNSDLQTYASLPHRGKSHNWDGTQLSQRRRKMERQLLRQRQMARQKILEIPWRKS